MNTNKPVRQVDFAPDTRDMTIYDLAIAWEWQYDADFVCLLEAVCLENHLSLLQITPGNLDNILQSLAFNEISFRAFFDRASDAKEQFLPLVEWARSQPVYTINPYGFACRAWNKAITHADLSNAGLSTPYTLIIPSCVDQPDMDPLNLGCFEGSFTIKPAHGGGGKGVIKQAKTWEEVLAARQQYPEDEYLLQAYINPILLDSRPAWFRVIYCCGQAYPCWWDTNTHVYYPISPWDEERLHLQPLREMAMRIARISNLDLFSTEIALSQQEQFTVVDYINDPVDLRLQSKAREGVPDEIVHAITKKIVELVISCLEPAELVLLES